MGLFDFFKKKSESNQIGKQETEIPIDNNLFLLQNLRNRLLELGYEVERHSQYLALIVNAEIEIATTIVKNPNNHPIILHSMILTINPTYFAKGIEENIVGIGTTIEEKVNSVIDNYIETTFLPIMDSFSDSHNPDLDFYTIMDSKEVLWHPKLGNLTFQGQWDYQPQNEPFFEIIKDKLKNKLTSNKLNWLKLYISKRADGTIIGECLFNNTPWEEGLTDITEYAKSWEMKSDFQGLKQFIMFRRCDAFDD
jgi:Family of unknown function (DUF6348)